MFLVQYRCIYRDYWYDDLEFDGAMTAIHRAQVLANETGRVTRVITIHGVLVWQGGMVYAAVG